MAKALSAEFGRGFSKRNPHYMARFAEVFPDAEIVHALHSQLSWTHFRELIGIEDPLKRRFYVELCRTEGVVGLREVELGGAGLRRFKDTLDWETLKAHVGSVEVAAARFQAAPRCSAASRPLPASLPPPPGRTTTYGVPTALGGGFARTWATPLTRSDLTRTLRGSCRWRSRSGRSANQEHPSGRSR